MRRFLTATLITVTLSGYGLTPAIAQSEGEQSKPAIAENVGGEASKPALAENTSDSKGAAESKPAAKPAAKGSEKLHTNIFTRVASTVAGTAVGIPVCLYKKSVAESVAATKDLVGDTSNKFLLAAGTPLGVPAGIISGVLQSPVVSFWHAWKNSADEPFSAEVFSLGEK